jgi:hypothetical protein
MMYTVLYSIVIVNKADRFQLLFFIVDKMRINIIDFFKVSEKFLIIDVQKKICLNNKTLKKVL